MAPKVSVLIPCYNHESYIAHTINSVLNQSFSDFELIVCDDCSTDNSRNVIDSFCDPRIKKVYPEKNLGVVLNLNNMISMASGEYIAVLGSDDEWQKEKLSRQVEVLDNNANIAACFTWADIIDETGNIALSCDFNTDIFNVDNLSQGERLKMFYNSGNHLCHSSLLIRKSVHDELGLYNISLRQLHDYDMWVRIINRYPIFVITDKLTLYRRASGNTTSISSAVLANKARLYNETAYVLYNMIDLMPEDIFKQHFAESECKDSIDITAQKLLTLYNCCYMEIKHDMANRYLFENSSDELLARLEEKYSLGLNDIYKRTALGSVSYSFEITNVYNSLSWKISRPVRLVGKILKRLRRKNNG